MTTAILLATDIVLCCVALGIRWHGASKNKPVVFSTALLTVIVAASAHVAAWLPFAYTALAHGAGTFDVATGMKIMAMLVLPGLPPMALSGWLLLDASSRGTAEALYGLDTGKPAASDYSKARALAKQEQVIAAVRQYRRYFDEDPKEPAPLFEAAQLLAKRKRVLDATALLEEIRKIFDKDDAVWVRATFNLAELNQHRARRGKTASDLLKEIMRRMPQTQYARDANERLTRMTGTGEAREASAEASANNGS